VVYRVYFPYLRCGLLQYHFLNLYHYDKDFDKLVTHYKLIRLVPQQEVDVSKTIVIILTMIFMLGFTQQADAGKKSRNAVLGFLVSTASTYLILKANNDKTGYDYPKRTQGEMVGYAGGVGMIVGLSAYWLTNDDTSNLSAPIIDLYKGKPKFRFPSLSVVRDGSNKQMRFKILSFTR
jgi:hypothetical protein